MADFKMFSDIAKEQNENVKEQLENLGHALDGEDINGTQFEVRASGETKIGVLSICVFMLGATIKIGVKDFVQMLMHREYDRGYIIAGAVILAAAVAFLIFGLLHYCKKRIAVNGTSITINGREYHCSDITSAKLGALSSLKLYHGEEKLVQVSLAEYENADKLASWLEKCNISVERDIEANKKAETVIKIAAMIAAVLLSVGIFLLIKMF